MHFELEPLPDDSTERQEKQREMGRAARKNLADDIRDGKLAFNEYDYVFITGDVFFRDNKITTEDFAEDSLIKAIQHSVPSDGRPHVFWCCGNHDIDETDSSGKLNKYHSNYKNVTGCDLPEDFESMHWLRKTKDFNLLVLNTNSKSEIKDEIDVIKSKNDDTGQPDIVQVCCASLEKLLANRDRTKPTLAIGHHALDWFSRSNQIQIASLFEKSDVDFYLCGHDHRLGYSQLDYSGKGIHQVTCGGCRHDGYGVFSVICGEYKNLLYHLTPYRYNHDGDGLWGDDTHLHRRLSYQNVFMRADVEKNIQSLLWRLWETPEFNTSEMEPVDVLKLIDEMLQELLKVAKLSDMGLNYIREFFSEYVYNYENTTGKAKEKRREDKL